LQFRSSRISQTGTECYHISGFPLNRFYSVTAYRTGLPLKPHCNPYRISQKENSLGAFPDSLAATSLFSNNRFPTRHIIVLLSSCNTTIFNRSSPCITQGRLHCNAYQAFAGYLQMLLLHLKSPRKLGPRPYAIMDRPLSLTPRINPRLGVSSQSQGLHTYALNGFLAPSS